MRLTLIAAMGLNRVIGRNGELPWHLPADLKHFRRQTVGKPILMGRLTYESIGRPLPKRRNLVLTRSSGYTAPGIEVLNCLDDVKAAVSDLDEVMVIGGGKVYEQLLPSSTRILLTVVRGDFEGDTHFPELLNENWSIANLEMHGSDEKNPWDYCFLDIIRRSAGPPLPMPFPGVLFQSVVSD